MAVADSAQRYPQATPDGQPIPFEIIRPLGLILQAFTSVPVNAVAIPAGADFLVLESTQACLVRFGANVTVPANGVHTTDLVYLSADVIKVIDHNAAASFSVVQAGAESGTLYVQTCQKYSDIRNPVQDARM